MLVYRSADQMLDVFDYLCTGFKAFHEFSIDFNSQISGIIYDRDMYDIDIDDIDSPSDDSSSDLESDDESDLESDNESNKRKISMSYPIPQFSVR